jgi:hypothetical protein
MPWLGSLDGGGLILGLGIPNAQTMIGDGWGGTYCAATFGAGTEDIPSYFPVVPGPKGPTPWSQPAPVPSFLDEMCPPRFVPKPLPEEEMAVYPGRKSNGHHMAIISDNLPDGPDGRPPDVGPHFRILRECDPDYKDLPCYTDVDAMIGLATFGDSFIRPRPITSVPEAGGDALKGIRANKIAGDAWEKQVIEKELPKTQTQIQPQITIRSNGPSGLRTRLDAVGTDKSTGAVKLTDAKASATAPLTANQGVVYPELETHGGVVVGKGKPPYIGGTPATRVDFIRKP